MSITTDPIARARCPARRKEEPMIVAMRRFVRNAVLLALLSAPLGCANTPTVPVPPPEITEIDAPEEDGWSRAWAPKESVEPGDVVLVWNETAGHGVMVLAEEDGSFDALIEASAGDEIIVQVKRNNRLSREEGHFVPKP